MLPLIISMSKLVSLHPSGGFYTFGSKEINPYAGFVSAWSYITGKLASAVIITQIAVLLLQQVIPLLASIPSLLLNGAIICTFLALNLLDIKTGSMIQTWFFGLKIIPILCGIGAGLYLFSPTHITVQESDFSGIPIALPLVLFALAGFEAACSLSSRIKDAKKNAPRAILYSYGFVIVATTLFQFMIYGGLGTVLSQLPDYRYLFPALIGNILPPGSSMGTPLIKLIHIAIACSALGGAYGIIFSNTWNVYTLAQHNHLFASHALSRFNKHHIPYLCVLVEGIIYFIFLIISHGNQLPLQQLGALGPTIAYGLSALSLWYAVQRKAISLSQLLPVLALGSCLILFSASIYSLITFGMSSLITFGALFIFGSIMFWATKLQY